MDANPSQKGKTMNSPYQIEKILKAIEREQANRVRRERRAAK